MKSQVGFIDDKQYCNIKEGFLLLKEFGIVYANYRIISKSSHIKNVEIFSHKVWGMEYVENEYEKIDPIELGIKNTKNSIFDWSWLPLNKIHIQVMKIRKEKYGIHSGITCVLEKDHHLLSVSLAHSSQENFLKQICSRENFLIKNYIDNTHSALLHHAYSI
jgi:hypothetical protein